MKIDLHGKTHPEGLELIEEYMSSRLFPSHIKPVFS